VNNVGIIDGQLEGDDCACRVTGHVSASDAQVVEQRGRVGRMLGETDRLHGMGATDLSPLVIPDQAVALDQCHLREERQEAVPDGAEADEDHWLA
jgi:hypothetical protein